MTYESEHIERDRMAVELVEIFADGKLRAAILSDCYRRDALRDLRRCRGILIEATIGMVVGVNETRRYYQAVRIDHSGTVRNLDLRALPDGANGISFDYDNSVFDGRTTRAVNQRCPGNRDSVCRF